MRPCLVPYLDRSTSWSTCAIMVARIAINLNASSYQQYFSTEKEQPHWATGTKICLPESVLRIVSRNEVRWPLFFRVTVCSAQGHARRAPPPTTTTEQGNLPSRAGCIYVSVDKFVPTPNSVVLSDWALDELGIDVTARPSTAVRVEYVEIPKATFLSLQPLDAAWSIVTNPMAVMEVEMRQITAVQAGMVIRVPFLERLFSVRVASTSPPGPVSTVEVDVSVSFDWSCCKGSEGRGAAAMAAASGSGAEQERETLKVRRKATMSIHHGTPPAKAYVTMRYGGGEAEMAKVALDCSIFC